MSSFSDFQHPYPLSGFISIYPENFIYNKIDYSKFKLEIFSCCSGILAVVWGMLCAKYGSDSPRTHKFISEEENTYIQSNQCDLSQDDSVCLI